jgi:uncharacterized membrane protein
LLSLCHIALAQDVVCLSTSNLDPTILKQVLSQLELNISPAAIRAMFNAKTGHNLSHQQVLSLRRSVVIDGQGETPAERLLLYLKQSDDIRFVALTARKEKGSLITIRISKKDRSSYNEMVMADNTTDQGDTSAGNPKTYAEQIMKALRLKDDDTLLLGAAWITKEG